MTAGIRTIKCKQNVLDAWELNLPRIIQNIIALCFKLSQTTKLRSCLGVQTSNIISQANDNASQTQQLKGLN